MQKQFYISCMKINGIPLLPPMMTDTIKEEMRHYKSLAIKIEENLRDRRLVKHTIQDKCMQAVILEPIDMLKNIRYSSDSDISTRDIASDTNNKDSYSKMTIVEPLLQVEGETKDSHDIQSSISDVQHLQLQVCLANDINDSKLTAAVTDRNSVDAIETATPDEDVTLLENWKPEIPKTLNVLPITLSKVEEDTSSIEISKETPENLPKLSRQGSYILDTPSPILLAHMHTKLTDEKYIPTPTTNVSQLKQWNIAQPKAEWENKQFMVEHIQDLSKLECTPKQSTSQYRESDDSTESHQANKSTNCTKMVIVEEDTSKSDAIPIKHNHRYNTDFKKQSSLEKLEKNSDIGVLNLLSSKYTEDTNSPKIQLSYIDEGLHNKKENIVEYHDSANKTKSSTPNKLLMVYKEIEEMHKKQMMELIYRQRKEQSLLQAEFQKQQILLLAEIQKCASGISHQTNALNVALNRSLSSDEAKPTSHEARQQMDTDSPSNIHTEMDYNIKLPSANRMIVQAVNTINAYTRGYLIRRLMRTERVITLKKIYKEALQCMLKLHVDAPLNLAEVEFLHRLQLQCDAASMNIVELFAQSPTKRMKIIAHDREIKESRTERPTSARSYSFATQKTLARKNLKEFESTMAKYQQPSTVKRNLVRSRCQTWTSDIRDRLMSPNALYRGIRRSTSTGAVRKPWR
ncbi:Centrosomal protein of 110 kDa [Acromyrmex echinatior]|uniref:Centrosomal protein of 110 kDa n=1 Tax=Acromyrmex echinatior TaxID=103372 RepID=F4WDR0_ACREC|nr:Centrosomal protein of 110 kDa [Acromyrmex echinatior]